MQALDSEIFRFRQLLISHWFSDQRKSQSQTRKNRNGSDALKIQTPRSGHRWLQTSGIYNKRKILTVGRNPFQLMNCRRWEPIRRLKISTLSDPACGRRARKAGSLWDDGGGGGGKRSAVRTRAFRAPAMSSAVTLEILLTLEERITKHHEDCDQKFLVECAILFFLARIVYSSALLLCLQLSILGSRDRRLLCKWLLASSLWMMLWRRA